MLQAVFSLVLNLIPRCLSVGLLPVCVLGYAKEKQLGSGMRNSNWNWRVLELARVDFGVCMQAIEILYTDWNSLKWLGIQARRLSDLFTNCNYHIFYFELLAQLPFKKDTEFSMHYLNTRFFPENPRGASSKTERLCNLEGEGLFRKEWAWMTDCVPCNF